MTELADKIEAAEGCLEAKMLDAAWEYLAPRMKLSPASLAEKASDFGMKMDARAWLDAAMTLVPEGDDVCWTMGNAPWTQFCARIWSCDPAREEPFDVAASAATPALALCAAALRAGGTDE